MYPPVQTKTNYGTGRSTTKRKLPCTASHCLFIPNASPSETGWTRPNQRSVGDSFDFIFTPTNVSQFIPKHKLEINEILWIIYLSYSRRKTITSAMFIVTILGLFHRLEHRCVAMETGEHIQLSLLQYLKADCQYYNGRRHSFWGNSPTKS